jgi:hypothetical protein
MAQQLANLPAPSCDEQVDRFIERAAHSHFMQSRAWLETFADERESVEHVVTSSDGGEPACCSGVRRVRGRGWTGDKCFVDGGPVFTSETFIERHLDELLTATRGASWLRLRPYLPERDAIRFSELLRDHAFRMLPADQQSGYAQTLVLDLTRSPQSLHAGFSTGLRRNLRRAARLGMTVDRVTGGSGSAEFAAMLSGAAAVAGYDVPPPARITRYLEKVCGHESNAGALFCVKRSGELQAGIVVLRAGSSLVYQWGARAHPCGSGDVPLAHALHWEAMRWARAHGFERYDFGGLTGVDERDGIDRFKQSFGGERQRMFGEALHARGFWGHVTTSGTGRFLARLRSAAVRGGSRRASHA